MNIQINSDNAADGSREIETTVGSKRIYVGISSLGVNVLCRNAAHRAWRGTGRFFDDFAAAREGYKSGAMKAAIDYAETLAAEAAIDAEIAKGPERLTDGLTYKNFDERFNLARCCADVDALAAMAPGLGINLD